MSGPHDHPIGMTPLDRFDPNYAVYDSQYTGLQRTSGPSTPYEGFGFWYRPENQESIYTPDAALFDQARTMQPPAMDIQLALKHKRTRSGCFTCRHRRVKCDETKPICDRCRKGNRSCEFPSKTSAPKKMKTTEPTSPAVEREQSIDDPVSATIKEESEEDTSEPDEEESSPKQKQVTPGSQRTSTNHVSTTSSERSRASPDHLAGRAATEFPTLWKDLKPEMQMYLHFQKDNMTHYHYLFKVDPQDFVHSELISLAMQFEPLLYAVVAFAAYHHTIRLPDEEAEFNSFWKYYCKSIVKLRQFLESNKERNDLVLLTVLQLATFEEYMGDWNNLVSHHRAAYGILTSKYTPETIMETDRGRKIFDWYIRLDVIAGLMAVRDASLDRAWLAYAYEWHEERARSTDQDHLLRKQEFFGKAIELVAHDTAHLFAQANEKQAMFDSGQQLDFSLDEIMSEVKSLSDRLDKLRCRIQELHDPSLVGIDRQASHQVDDAVFTSRVPLFRGALWPLNFVWIDWYGVLILMKNSMLGTLQKALRSSHVHTLSAQHVEYFQQQALTVLPELSRYSKIQCEIFNAVSASTTAPAGVTLVCYASLGLSTVFLPKAPPEQNSKYTMWARQQLANIECQGYVWPPHFRKEMANLWGISEIEDWWLPNEEGKTRIIGEIRAVIVDRARIAQLTEKPGQTQSRDLREIKGLFEMLDLDRRGGTDGSGTSSRLDTAYVSSSAGMINAASMVSSPESSTSSASGLTSPRGSVSDAQGSQRKGQTRRKSRSSVSNNFPESPATQSRPAPVGRQMTQPWEDQRR